MTRALVSRKNRGGKHLSLALMIIAIHFVLVGSRQSYESDHKFHFEARPPFHGVRLG
jgi:hypothetical protein